jgi:hypothetical protein
MWVLFEWDEEGWADFVSDPEVPPILREARHLGSLWLVPLAWRTSLVARAVGCLGGCKQKECQQ